MECMMLYFGVQMMMNYKQDDEKETKERKEKE